MANVFHPAFSVASKYIIAHTKDTSQWFAVYFTFHFSLACEELVISVGPSRAEISYCLASNMYMYVGSCKLVAARRTKHRQF